MVTLSEKFCCSTTKPHSVVGRPPSTRDEVADLKIRVPNEQRRQHPTPLAANGCHSSSWGRARAQLLYPIFGPSGCSAPTWPPVGPPGQQSHHCHADRHRTKDQLQRAETEKWDLDQQLGG
jgi:hypothetical protein